MTKVVKKNVKCAKCETESQQMIVFSVNFLLENAESAEKLTKHQQVCPKCNYTETDISVLIEEGK